MTIKFVYDTGALVAAERRDMDFWALHDEAMAIGARPVVPVVVLGQAWRGGPQHNLSRLLKGCVAMDVDESLCRSAGGLCGRAGTSDIVDALVVVAAMRQSAAIVTSDPDDINQLVAASGHRISVLRV